MLCDGSQCCCGKRGALYECVRRVVLRFSVGLICVMDGRGCRDLATLATSNERLDGHKRCVTVRRTIVSPLFRSFEVCVREQRRFARCLRASVSVGRALWCGR